MWSTFQGMPLLIMQDTSFNFWGIYVIEKDVNFVVNMFPWQEMHEGACTWTLTYDQ